MNSKAFVNTFGTPNKKLREFSRETSKSFKTCRKRLKTSFWIRDSKISWLYFVNINNRCTHVHLCWIYHILKQITAMLGIHMLLVFQQNQQKENTFLSRVPKLMQNRLNKISRMMLCLWLTLPPLTGQTQVWCPKMSMTWFWQGAKSFLIEKRNLQPPFSLR